MPINSRQKGKRGELELCQVLHEAFGWDVQRSVQYSGNAGDADLVVRQHPELFVECKRVQNLNLHKAMSLAVEQAGGDKVAAVFHRKDKSEWLVTCRLEDLARLSSIVEMALRHTAPGP